MAPELIVLEQVPQLFGQRGRRLLVGRRGDLLDCAFEQPTRAELLMCDVPTGGVGWQMDADAVGSAMGSEPVDIGACGHVDVHVV